MQHIASLQEGSGAESSLQGLLEPGLQLWDLGM